MRDIKFRVWDSKRKRFLEHYEFIIEFNGTVSNVDYVEIGTKNKGAVLETFTGLKDKNGVDVYEGDIVSEITQFDDEPDLYEVVYNETGDYPAFDLKGWTGEVNGISELSLTCGIEVIGNIHTNPDLLEAQS